MSIALLIILQLTIINAFNAFNAFNDLDSSSNPLSFRQWHYDSFHKFFFNRRHCGETDFHQQCSNLLQQATDFINENNYQLISIDRDNCVSQDMDSFMCSCVVTIFYKGSTL